MRHDYRENLGLAFDTLRTHKLRSFLTVVGVMIGVGVIILVVGLLDGFKNTINQEILAWGADTAYVDRFDSDVNHDHPSENERARKPLTLDDGEALLARCPAIERIAISVFEYEDIHNIRRDKNQVQGAEMRGTFPAFVQVYGNAAMKYGRFFTETENDHREDVVVIGEDVAKALFPEGEADALGKDVNLDGSTMRVIGVFEKPKGGFGMGDTDRRVVLPYYTFRKIYPAAYEHGYRIEGYPGQLDRAVDQAREALRRLRKVPYNKPDTFSITTQKEQVQQFNQIIGGVVLAMIVISSIGLLIGGVGVMNIMLVSVTERTREIGVRKAIGARRSDITWQFLFEAMTLTGTGGVIGIILAVSIVLLIPRITSLQTTVSPGAILAGEVVSIGIGLIFGVWPAVKAARLDPVEALRYE